MKITILHLSDIQFGRHYVQKPGSRVPLYPSEDYTSELRKLTDDLDILIGIGVKPNFIVVSGDIAEWSLREEYVQAEQFLSGLCSHLGIDRRHVILTPGNHDVNRDLCKAARLIANARGSEFRKPFYAKFELYDQFFNNFYKQVQWPEGVWPYRFCEEKLYVNYLFPEYGVVFAGLNSCIDESDEEPHYGIITTDQLRKANDEINQYDSQHNLLRIAVFHHNYLRGSGYDNENLKDAEELKPLFINGGYQLMLHGHQHINKKEVTGTPDKVISILATGSAGLDAENLPANCRRYQVIEIDTNKVYVYRRWFDNTEMHYTGLGCWKADLAPTQTNIFEEFNFPNGHRSEFDGRFDLTEFLDESEFKSFVIDLVSTAEKTTIQTDIKKVNIEEKFKKMDCDLTFQNNYDKYARFFPSIDEIMLSTSYVSSDKKDIICDYIISVYHRTYLTYSTGADIVEAMVDTIADEYTGQFTYSVQRLKYYLRVFVCWSINECDIFNEDIRKRIVSD